MLITAVAVVVIVVGVGVGVAVSKRGGSTSNKESPTTAHVASFS